MHSAVYGIDGSPSISTADISVYTITLFLFLYRTICLARLFPIQNFSAPPRDNIIIHNIIYLAMPGENMIDAECKDYAVTRLRETIPSFGTYIATKQKIDYIVTNKRKMDIVLGKKMFKNI